MRILLTNFLVLVSTLVLGQWGIRAGVQWERLSPSALMNGNLSLDHDLNDKLSFSLDLIAGFGLKNHGSARIGSDPYNYEAATNTYGFTYHSRFFTGNIDRTAFYFGPFLGYRKATISTTPETASYFYLNAPPVFATKQKFNGSLFPVGMRIGLRDPLDGFFGDVFFAVGTLLGDTERFNRSTLDPKHMIGGVFLQAGYSVGGGW